MAGNTIGQSGKVYAMAALPFIAMPVQEVPLLSYALAHKSVNSSYTITASNNDDVSMALMNGDPYTSAEQKQRDLYEINDTDWYSVSFEGVYSSSVCHLAMHQDWIQSKGYVTDGIVNMNLPEQGISGPFKITSIKHIIPQKKPVDEDPNDDYEYKPVTGLFIHHSDQVHNITFSNNETIGVTAPHPIFSTTHNDWRLAGELEVGEKVLTYHGEATVTNTEKKTGSEAVYNLEVKDLHNFLVGDVGVVVHNECMGLKLKLIFKKFTPKKQSGTKWVDYIEESGKLTDLDEIQQFEALGEKLGKRIVGLEKSPNTGNKFPGLDGFIDDGKGLSLKATENFDSAKARLKEMCNKARNLDNGTVPNEGNLAGILSDGIAGMISNKNGFPLTKLELKNAWNAVLGDNQINTDIMNTLFIKGSDGWLKWTKADGWITGF
jgi:hypothetical protein